MLESLVLDVRSSSFEYISSTMSKCTSKSIGEHKTSPLFQMNHLTLSDSPLDVILMDGKSNEDDAGDIFISSLVTWIFCFFIWKGSPVLAETMWNRGLWLMN